MRRPRDFQVIGLEAVMEKVDGSLGLIHPARAARQRCFYCLEPKMGGFSFGCKLSTNRHGMPNCMSDTSVITCDGVCCLDTVLNRKGLEFSHLGVPRPEIQLSFQRIGMVESVNSRHLL